MPEGKRPVAHGVSLCSTSLGRMLLETGRVAKRLNFKANIAVIFFKAKH